MSFARQVFGHYHYSVKCVYPGKDGIGPDLVYMFQKGDHVVYNGGHPARVIFTMPDGKVRIKFVDTQLIPPKMTVPEESLTPDYNHARSPVREFDPEFECPDCGVEWKVTQIAIRQYFDCPQCGMKKEDAC